MRRVLRSGLKRRDQHLLDLLGGDRRRPPRPRIIREPIQPQLAEPPAPLAHRRRRHPTLRRHLLVRPALRALQNDPRAQRQRLRGLPPALPPHQLLALGVTQLQRLLGTSSSDTNLRRVTLGDLCLCSAYMHGGPRESAGAVRRQQQSTRVRPLLLAGEHGRLPACKLSITAIAACSRVAGARTTSLGRSGARRSSPTKRTAIAQERVAAVKIL